MTTAVHIREMQEADLPCCVELCMAAYSNHFLQLLQERYGLLGHTSWEESERAAVRATFAQHREQMLVATLDQEVVGYSLYHYARLLDGRVGIGYLSNNAVDPRLQGRGIGKLLGHAVLETFRRLQLDYARTTTSSQACQAPARCVYQRLGYTLCRQSLDWTIDLRKHPIKACQPQGIASLVTRRATPDDLERILSIGLAYFDGISLYARWPHCGLAPDLDWQAIQRQSVGTAMHRWMAQTLVTESEGEVIGYITFDVDEQTSVGTTNVLRGQGEDMALNNAIDPRHRGKGLEAYQLACVLEIFQDKGLAVGITRGLDAMARTQLGLTFDYNAWGFTPLRGYIDLFMRIP
jgi:GNAT superfamily N-acetyltransferase